VSLSPPTASAPTPTLACFAARYLFIGLYFGFVLVKSEVVSWYRIQEMFRFDAFHMYGVLGSAVAVAMIAVWLVRRFGLRARGGHAITFRVYQPGWARYLLGGSLFGVGWALTGACPGPIAALIGAGVTGFVVVLLAAVAGTWTYAHVRGRLPH
jgi:uncharacterized protein